MSESPDAIRPEWVDVLAAEIRRVDGNHDLGAGALAERLMPFCGDIAEAARGDLDIDVLRELALMTGERNILRAERDAALAEVERVREQLTFSRLAQFAPMGDNHHNAAVCPYCSPLRDREAGT